MRKRNSWRRWLNLGGAVIVTGGLTYVCAVGVGPLPALGPTFNPATGVWTMAQDANLPKTQSLHIAGLDKPTQITFDKHGTAYIHAKTDHDLFLATGYLHAKFRLFQMDLMRRQGEGLLSQVVGAKALPSDEFEDQLGLQRTATEEWQGMTANDPARQALVAYTQGVNDVIAKDKQSGTLPALFKLLGYQPATWTPIDSLVIQGDMTQTLDFSTGALEEALLVKSLGYQKTLQWFPVLPPDAQQPYDTGPYAANGVAPIETAESVGQPEANAAKALLTRFKSLPKMAIHHGSNSNNWVVDGTKTASGQAMMAGDPHLDLTLPSIWYQISAQSPSYQFSGVSIPGVPSILIGHNQDISWSLTNVQNQATLYYEEETSPAHPNQYYWNGAWRKMKQVHYTIPVKGKHSVPLTVNLTVHGPIINQDGQTLAVDWMGAQPSPDIDAILRVLKAKNFQDFKSALSTWHAPSQNFVYADNKGNIGLISAGCYPIVKHGDPYLPLSGTGADDVVGTIPYQDVPQSYNPKTHILFSANQREVGPDYPYYIGTTMDFFDNGYRADEIEHYLATHDNMTSQNFEQLQNDTHDWLAAEIVPKLEQALKGQTLSGRAQQAANLLKSWNGDMDADSPAASIWWTFWTQYLNDTFAPWWQAAKVPTNVDPSLAVGPGQTSLDEDLESWTLHDANNASFDLPDGTKRSAQNVMQQAFTETVASLTKQLGTSPNQWQWGKLHSRAIPSLAQISSLGYSARSAGGDRWTVDAADGGMVSTAGPSWRMIIDWGAGDEAVYPGGQSENPLSPWYQDQINAWWNGQYFPLTTVNQVDKSDYHPTWTLAPSQSGGKQS